MLPFENPGVNEMFSRTARALGALKRSLRSMTQILDVQRAALDHERVLVVAAVDDFVRRVGLPAERLHHCRFITKKRLLELYEQDVVYDGTVEDGCLLFDIKRDIRLFVPFSGFDEYIGLCWDVLVQGYRIGIRRPFVFIDIGLESPECVPCCLLSIPCARRSSRTSSFRRSIASDCATWS